MNEIPKVKKINKVNMITEYEECKFNTAWKAVKSYEDGDSLWYSVNVGVHIQIRDSHDAITYLANLYRKVERPITWQEAATDFVKNSEELNIDMNLDWLLGEGSQADEFKEMCAIVTSLTKGE